MDKLLHDTVYATTDASIWAQEFCKINPSMDEGTMIGWFANAIETAKSITRAEATGAVEICHHHHITNVVNK